MRQHLERRLEVLAREIRGTKPHPRKDWRCHPDILVFNGKHELAEPQVIDPAIKSALAPTSEHAGFKTGDRVVITHPDAWCNGFQATLEINKGANFFQEVRTTFDERPGLFAPYCTWTLSALGKYIQHVAEKRPFAVGQIRKIVATEEQLNRTGLRPTFNQGDTVVITDITRRTEIGGFVCKLRAKGVDKLDLAFPEEFLE